MNHTIVKAANGQLAVKGSKWLYVAPEDTKFQVAQQVVYRKMWFDRVDPETGEMQRIYKYVVWDGGGHAEVFNKSDMKVPSMENLDESGDEGDE